MPVLGGFRRACRRAIEKCDEFAPSHCPPEAWTSHRINFYTYSGRVDVRFGSKADMCVAKSDVRFTPNSDRESGIPANVTSALPPKADMCSALVHVCFGPKADIGTIAGVQVKAATRGKVTVISVNSPGCVSTSIEPPCCFTMMS